LNLLVIFQRRSSCSFWKAYFNIKLCSDIFS
jgi:hypothetical protein